MPPSQCWNSRLAVCTTLNKAFTCYSKSSPIYLDSNIVKIQSRQTTSYQPPLLQRRFTTTLTTMDINGSSFSYGGRLQPSPQTAFQPRCLSPANPHIHIRRFSNSTANRLSSTSTIGTPAPQSTTIPKMTSMHSQDFKLALSKHGLTEDHLSKIHGLLVEIAIDCGKIMAAAEHSVLIAAQYKNNTSDLVTEFDKQIEDTVESRLRKEYPAFRFLGEETFKHGTKLADTPTFVCDPIDGTLNFSKGVPNCAISLALTLEKKSIIGVVYNPFRGDLYHAIKGRGAYLSNALLGVELKLPIQPVPPPMPSLNSCLVALEWGNQRSGENWALRTSVHNKLLTSKVEGGAMCKSVRSNGSAALDFCYVAQGIIDVFWEGGVWIWDVCAGWIILEEAGGIVASANPGDWDPSLEGRLYFAVRHAKPEEQKAVVQELWGIMGDRKFVF